MFRETISKEELAELPLRQFEGKITLVDTEQECIEAVAFLSRQKVLGFDTETKPNFKRGSMNGVALLQFSTDHQAYLFRIKKLGLPVSLKKLMADPSIMKVGVAIHDDIKALQRISPFEPKGFIELQSHVLDFGIQNFSLKKLSGIVLGFRISKSQRLTNWEADELTEAQQIYAATDAWVSYEIFQSLKQ